MVSVKAWVSLEEPKPLGSEQVLVGVGLQRQGGRELVRTSGQDPGL